MEQVAHQDAPQTVGSFREDVFANDQHAVVRMLFLSPLVLTVLVPNCRSENRSFKLPRIC